MNSRGRVVDAWMQHPTKDFLVHPMFESLRRWAHGALATVEVPIETTIRSEGQPEDFGGRFMSSGVPRLTRSRLVRLRGQRPRSPRSAWPTGAGTSPPFRVGTGTARRASPTCASAASVSSLLAATLEVVLVNSTGGQTRSSASA